MKALLSYLLRSLLLILPLLLTSCSIYQDEFDCPPDIGVPCTSSSDIESMVLETEIGPDIFLPKESVEIVRGYSQDSACCVDGAKVWNCSTRSYEYVALSRADFNKSYYEPVYGY